jgi:hypothetical protein
MERRPLVRFNLKICRNSGHTFRPLGAINEPKCVAAKTSWRQVPIAAGN